MSMPADIERRVISLHFRARHADMIFADVATLDIRARARAAYYLYVDVAAKNIDFAAR